MKRFHVARERLFNDLSSVNSNKVKPVHEASGKCFEMHFKIFFFYFQTTKLLRAESEMSYSKI